MQKSAVSIYYQPTQAAGKTKIKRKNGKKGKEAKDSRDGWEKGKGEGEEKNEL